MSGVPLPHEVRGSGHPVVLIHAENVDRRLWAYQMDAFADRFRVVRYDSRNHGHSPRCSGMYDAGQDLLDLLDALDVGTAHLIGAGAGGNIALEFALLHPDRVSALVLVASGLNRGGGQDLSEVFEAVAPMLESFAHARLGDPAPLIDRLVASPTSPERGPAKELLRQMLRDNTHLLQSSPCVPKPIDPPAIGRLSEISVPTLVMVGERDLDIVKENADTLQQGIAGATKVIASGAGRFPNLDNPDFFNDTVVRFLAGIQSSPPKAP